MSKSSPKARPRRLRGPLDETPPHATNDPRSPAVGLGGFYPPPPGPRQHFGRPAGTLGAPQAPPGHRLLRPSHGHPDGPDDSPTPARPPAPLPRAPRNHLTTHARARCPLLTPFALLLRS